MFCAVTSQLISFFLWHLTWGWYQLCLHSIFLWFSLALVIPCGWFRAFWYSLVLHLATTLWLSFIIGFVMMFICKLSVLDQEQYAIVYAETQRITLSFAFFYNLSLFTTALLLRGLIPIPRTRLFVALCMSGITSALLITRFIVFG
jgi:hypothetical protein